MTNEVTFVDLSTAEKNLVAEKLSRYFNATELEYVKRLFEQKLPVDTSLSPILNVASVTALNLYHALTKIQKVLSTNEYNTLQSFIANEVFKNTKVVVSTDNLGRNLRFNLNIDALGLSGIDSLRPKYTVRYNTYMPLAKTGGELQQWNGSEWVTLMTLTALNTQIITNAPVDQQQSLRDLAALNPETFFVISEEPTREFFLSKPYYANGCICYSTHTMRVYQWTGNTQSVLTPANTLLILHHHVQTIPVTV